MERKEGGDENTKESLRQGSTFPGAGVTAQRLQIEPISWRVRVWRLLACKGVKLARKIVGLAEV